MIWLSRNIAAPGPYLVLCTTEKQYMSVLKHLKIKPTGDWVSSKANATTHILSNSKAGVACVVCVPVCNKSHAKIIGLLVHEAVHVWQAYVEDIGEDTPGAEQMAYGIQSISQELVNAYYKRIKKQGKKV